MTEPVSSEDRISPFLCLWQGDTTNTRIGMVYIQANIKTDIKMFTRKTVWRRKICETTEYLFVIKGLYWRVSFCDKGDLLESLFL